MFQFLDPAKAIIAEEDELASDPDEPPDQDLHLRPAKSTSTTNQYDKTKTNSSVLKKESLLTRALMSSPEISPVDSSTRTASGLNSIPSLSLRSSNYSAASTAELTSDGEITTPFRSNTPSPPLPLQYTRPPGHISFAKPNHLPTILDTDGLDQLEANLGRKRHITFACANVDQTQSDTTKDTSKQQELPKRKSTIQFVCPARPRDTTIDPKSKHVSTHRPSSKVRAGRSPAPPILRTRSSPSLPQQIPDGSLKASLSMNEDGSLRVTGLGKFEPSDATRFHEFGSSLEDEDWVMQVPEYKQKLTVADCMRKENAIRKLGEEAEAEALDDEEAMNGEDDEDEDEDEGDDDEDEDEDDDDDDDDDDDGATSTVHDVASDAGNESDNEAGFASSDDESDSSEYRFWTPITTAATSHSDSAPVPYRRRNSQDSIGSSIAPQTLHPNAFAPSAPTRKVSLPIKPKKQRQRAPSLPDSTDFVCGTLDEDRSLEAAYISRMEERRRLKHIPVPQDIDPSFPTSDPEDDDDDNDDDEEDEVDDDLRDNKTPEPRPTIKLPGNTDEDPSHRGRTSRRGSERISPHHSPRRLFGHSPRRLRSPPPPCRLRSPPPSRRPSMISSGPLVPPTRVNITGLAQRPNRTRTSSLPRTPNPFFARMGAGAFKQHPKTSRRAGNPWGRNNHTRGAIDIVAGLEKKREKRKEKFWRQHCRKAKDQHDRKPIPGRGAERMKELGLEAAERFRAFGIGHEVQLVLSI
ncbi:hypothetical protein FQN57_004546 [Myotisia sp. PD_48]|nr:hypothetical protein FQN57_004546 [Myotisia sp. PD_48]